MGGAADLIVTGRIYTVDRSRPWAEAMVVQDGRILAVGTADGLAAFRGPDTETIDLGDAFVMPGLVDVHNHHAHAGRAELFELTFPNTASLDEVLEAVRDHAKERGLSVVRWITAKDNETARRLYDRFAEKTKWVTYDLVP